MKLFTRNTTHNVRAQGLSIDGDTGAVYPPAHSDTEAPWCWSGIKMTDATEAKVGMREQTPTTRYE